MSYQLTRGAFDRRYLTVVETAVLSSRHLGASPLGGEFVRTWGFSIVFRRSELSRVVSDFPGLGLFFERALLPSCNAFYVNPLVMTRGSRVDPHVDCRLVEAENVRIVPNLVSVFYVRADPRLKGGALKLQLPSGRVLELPPATNELVHFVGSLVHSVGEVLDGGDVHGRISLVCEQYNLEDGLLAGFPAFEVLSGRT